MFKINKDFWIVFFVLFASLATVAKVSVHYGNSDDLDACSTMGQVTGLSDGPDGFLAVKDSPNIKAKRIDKLLNMQTVWVCEDSKGGKWLGVVYDPTGKKDCGVTSPIDKRKPYKGPCSSGWISKKYVKIIAG